MLTDADAGLSLKQRGEFDLIFEWMRRPVILISELCWTSLPVTTWCMGSKQFTHNDLQVIKVIVRSSTNRNLFDGRVRNRCHRVRLSLTPIRQWDGWVADTESELEAGYCQIRMQAGSGLLPNQKASWKRAIAQSECKLKAGYCPIRKQAGSGVSDQWRGTPDPNWLLIRTHCVLVFCASKHSRPQYPAPLSYSGYQS